MDVFFHNLEMVVTVEQEPKQILLQVGGMYFEPELN